MIRANLVAGILVLLFSHQIKAQDTLSIRMVGKAHPDSLVLRWAPAKQASWFHAQQVGFKLERCEYSTDISVPLVFQTLESNLKVKPREYWEKQFTPADTAAMMAYQLVFNPIKAESDANEEQLSDAAALGKNAFLFTMMAADRSKSVASALGLRYVDRNYDKNKTYLYRLTLNQIPIGSVADTAIVLMRANEIATVPKPLSPKTTPAEKAIKINWINPGSLPLVGYNLYRKQRDGSVKKCNKALILAERNSASGLVEYTFTDSVPNYTEFEYYTQGIDGFGDYSQFSPTVKGMARDFTPPAAPQITSIGGTKEAHMLVKWKMDIVPGDLRGFFAARAENMDGPYLAVSDVLNANQREFIDKKAPSHIGGFYKIVSIDTAGNAAESLPLYGYMVDSLPPTVPIGLNAVIDTNSVVTLTWPVGSEPDLLGYRVYYANSLNDENSCLTQQVLSDTIYRDTIAKRVLTKFIYYRIAAVDNNMNTSKPGAWVKVRRLDVIAPEPAVFKDFVVGDSTVQLAWINSNSDDVAAIKLLYRKQGDSMWNSLGNWNMPDTISNYMCNALDKKTWYEFTIETTDSSGLKSLAASPVQLRTYDRGIRKGVSGFSGTLSEDKKSIVLKWSGNFKPGTRYLIYRKAPGASGFTKYKVVKDVNEFSDTSILELGEYTYTLKVLHPDGGESLPEENVKVIRTL
jgi:hypothetical protein